MLLQKIQFAYYNCWNNNICMNDMQVYATIKSGSIAIAASTLDSLLDLMAGGILWFTHLAMKSINIYKYPIGKLRVQPVGIIIFAAVMATLGMWNKPYSTLSFHWFFICFYILNCNNCGEIHVMYTSYFTWLIARGELYICVVKN